MSRNILFLTNTSSAHEKQTWVFSYTEFNLKEPFSMTSYYLSAICIWGQEYTDYKQHHMWEKGNEDK